jgi:hypothetical protein
MKAEKVIAIIIVGIFISIFSLILRWQGIVEASNNVCLQNQRNAVEALRDGSRYVSIPTCWL